MGFNPGRPENIQRTDVRFTCTYLSHEIVYFLLVYTSLNGSHQPLARVWEDSVAHPNLCEHVSLELAAYSASRLQAGLGRALCCQTPALASRHMRKQNARDKEKSVAAFTRWCGVPSAHRLSLPGLTGHYPLSFIHANRRRSA